MFYKYSHPNLFRDFDNPDFSKFKENIILWGAGRIGGVAEYCLRMKGIHILAFCDIAKDKWGTTFCGHKVISPHELESNYPNAVVVITTVFHSSIYPELKNKGFANVFDATSLFMEIDFDGYDFWMTPDYAIRNVEQYIAAILEQKKEQCSIDQIFLNITTKCSLRCRDCSMFIPYVINPCNYDASIIMKDFNNVLNCLGSVRIVNFYGGEPLLHPDLVTMIKSLKHEKRIERISIITNATIMPSDELIQAMRADKRFWVRISDYGEISPKVEELTNLLKENDIDYEVANYTYWDQPSRITYLDSTEEELVTKFRHCTACNVLFLLNSKVYLCSTGSAVCNMNVFPPSESNYLDLSGYANFSKKMMKELNDFIIRPKQGKYLDACRYCSGGHCIQFEKKVPVALQTKELLKFDKIY